MADLHRWIELSGLSTDPHLDETLKSLSLKRAKPAQSPYDIDENEFPRTQVGLWHNNIYQSYITSDSKMMKFIIRQPLMKEEVLGLYTKRGIKFNFLKHVKACTQ